MDIREATMDDNKMILWIILAFLFSVTTMTITCISTHASTIDACIAAGQSARDCASVVAH